MITKDKATGSSGKRKLLIIGISVVVTIACSIFMMGVGRYSISLSDVFAALMGHGLDKVNTVVFKLRLPRIICAILIGAALASSGAVYQGLFQNPLVSPDILGVSAGACVGAIIAILNGLSSTATMVFAFVTGIISVSLAVLLAMLTKKSRLVVMVFSGVIVGRFMSSLVGILIFFANDETQLSEIIEWEMGSLAKVTQEDVRLFAPPLLLCIVLLFFFFFLFNLLSVGDVEAKALGVNVFLERLLFILLATMATAISVCIGGTIAWIGLIIPHLCRWLIKDDNRYVIPLSITLGGIALLLSDTVARTLLPYEMPLEVVTGLIGTPIFAIIMIKRWKE